MSHCQGEELERLMERYNQQSHAFAQQGGDTYKSEVVGVIKGLGFGERELLTEFGYPTQRFVFSPVRKSTGEVKTDES